ncbi:MAG: hypothetical protein KAV82_02720 [Phycisphaerae bacterium]|nr:hypothetical protein [Phycisphaerae bacterium]
MQRMVMWKEVVSVGVAVIVCGGLLPGATYGQVYEEDFSDYSADDWDNGYCEVRWCSGTEYTNSYNCGTPVALYFDSSSDDDIVWAHFGDQGCTQAEIRFNYGQCAPYNSACLYPPYPSCYPLDDLADTTLKVNVSTSDSLSCYTSINTLARNLNLTWTTSTECYAESHTVNLGANDRAVYWKFDKGTHPCSLVIDDVEIYLYGCECGPGECVTELDEDFGYSFQSGPVCDHFPETFEACEGNGPYLSSGTDCGGTGDEVMVFGSNFPYSAATLRCIDLSGVTAASLTFNYTKDDSTLGPELRASLDGVEFPYPPLWSAPFNFGGGCAPMCVDLSDYVGESTVWLKFISGTSSPTSAIDDILLVMGEGCPSCTDPVADAGPDKPLCSGTTVVLDGSAGGGSGGLCPGDYSPSWEGPGIVLGGDTFTPTVEAPGTYTLTVSCDTCEDTDDVVVTEGAFGDWDNDGTLDLGDFAVFESCLTGPGGGLARPDCMCGDFDEDWDVDLDDFSDLQVAFDTE